MDNRNIEYCNLNLLCYNVPIQARA